MTDLQPESSVSYVATVYNKKSFLEQVLGAIEAEWQDTGGEIILVDDGSTDGSLELLNDFKGGRDNIVVHTGPNRGPAAATNIGFNGASCRYLRFVDGDDIICRGSTQKLMAALRAHDVGFAYGKHCYAEDFSAASNGQNTEVITDPTRRMIFSQPFVPSATLADRARISAAFPLPEDLRNAQDFIMGLRISFHTSFVALDEICCLYAKEVPGRLSASKAQLFSYTARLTAAEWQTGAAWQPRHERFAVQRNAGRAYHYARRHLNCPLRKLLWLRFIRIVAAFPVLNFNPGTLHRIADIYLEALSRPEDYP